MHWRRKWQPTPVFLPGESQGWGILLACHLWGRTELDMTEVTQQQQQIIISLVKRFCLVDIEEVSSVQFSHSVMSDSLRPDKLAHQAPLSMGFFRPEYWSG